MSLTSSTRATLLADIAVFSLCLIAQSIQVRADGLEARLEEIATLYDNPDGAVFQKVKWTLFYQHQLAYTQGKDQADREFSDGAEHIRRFQVGISGDWFNSFGFTFKSRLARDRNSYPNDTRQFGHESFINANVTFKADKVFDTKIWEKLTFGYGRRAGRVADEWQRSPSHINALERSAFANKIWLSDLEGANPLGAWVKGTMGKHTLELALFSGTYDDWLAGWSDSKVYYLSWLGDYADSFGLDTADVRFTAYYQSGTIQQDRLANGIEWVGSSTTRWSDASWAVHTTLAAGDNGPQANPNREGSFWGAVIMPMYWIDRDKQKLVFRYQYQASEAREGIRLNSRFGRLAAVQDSFLDINSGRGDTHHNIYLGYNYYFLGDHLNLVTGIEWDWLSSDGIELYSGWTLGTGLRILL